MPRTGSKQRKKKHQRRPTWHYVTATCLGLLFLLCFLLFLAAPDRFPKLPHLSLDTIFEAHASPASVQTDTEDPTSSKTLEVYVLDVGQGDCIFLLSPDGRTMLIDTGEAQYYSVIESFLKNKGIEKLDVVIATHPHNDHIGSMDRVIENYDIGKFYMPEIAHTTETYNNMLSALREKGITPRTVYGSKKAQLSWGDDDVTIRFLSPFEAAEYDSINDESIVLRVEYGKTSVLLTGDAETYAESVMLANLPEEDLAATVLKLGHHGASTSTSEVFLKAVSPQIAVVSAGADNDYGHPHEETLALLQKYGIPLYRTDENGTIRIVLDGKTAKVFVEKE